MLKTTRLAKGHRGFSAAPAAVAAEGWPDLRDHILAGYPDTQCDHEVLALALLRVEKCSACARFVNVISAQMSKSQSIPELGKDALPVLLLIRSAALRLLRGEIKNQNVPDDPQEVVDYLYAELSIAPIGHLYGLPLGSINILIRSERLDLARMA